MSRRKGQQRTPTQREHDRAEIARRYLQGEPQTIIGFALSLSQSQVSRDLSVVRQQWRESAIHDFDEAKAQELARIDHLEQTYWQAWENSKKELSSRTQIIKQSGGRDVRSESQQLIIRTDETVGDKRWLEGVQWCISKRADILGLNAPTKVSPTSPDGKQPAVLGIGIYLPQKEAQTD